MLRTTICLAAFSLLLSQSVAQDWPALRGADGTGNLNTTNGVLKTGESFQFKTRWKKKLGSGYSSVVVSDNRVVTMYTDGTDDRVVCLDAKDGSTVWDIVTGPMFKGENGSFDGPISTPLISAGKVYALTASGKLFCLDFQTGDLVWSYSLPKDAGAAKPLYGFVTSPIMVEDTLVVQAGGPEKAVVGLDPNTGAERWAVGNDKIDSQTPSTIQLSQGKTLVLAAGGKRLLAVDPSNGDIQLEYEHGGSNGQAMTPVNLGDGNILLTLDDRFSTAVNLEQQSDGKVDAKRQWKERSIKNTYNIPVLCNGGVFAYSTRIFTCVDPQTGRAFWKTREPGDGFLITVDDYVLINTKKGSLHLVKASTDSYQEVAQMDLFEDLVWSLPAYSDNSIFTRSLGEIARVDIVASGQGSAVVDSTLPVGKNFATFLSSIENEADNDAKTKLVDQWIEGQQEFPMIEDGIAHFVYRGDQADVALAGDFFGARQEKEMTRVDGTDFFYHSIELPSDLRANYCFLVNFKPVLDPLNSRKMISTMYAGEMEFAVRLLGQAPLQMSWFGMPDWEQPEYLANLDGVETNLESHELEINDEGKTTKIDVLLPPNYEDNDQKYPVVYVFDGTMARFRGEMDKALTQYFAGEPNQASIVVFLNGGGPGFTEQLAEKIVPFVDEKYPTIADRSSRVVAGFGFTATGALLAGATKNDLFANVVAQSPLAFAEAEKLVVTTMEAVKQPTKVHLQWGRFDMFNPHENWDLRTSSDSIYQSIARNKNIEMSGGMVNDSTDWSSWKNRYHEIIDLLQTKE